MTILQNSGRVVLEDGPLLLLILAAIAWGVLLMLALFQRLSEAESLDAPHTALALGGWPAPVLLLSTVLIACRLLLGEAMAGGLTLLLAAAPTVLAIRILRGRLTWGTIVPPALFLVLVFLRLGYAEGVLLPPYFDSAQHYRIIRSLLASRPGAELSWPTDSYYHIGYHVITAALTALSGSSPAHVMIIFGQVILAALPLPVYFLVHHVTGSGKAALTGVALAALGWSMPAHAVNWGKYPALLSLLLLEFALAAGLLRQGRLLVLSIFCAVLIQTRVIILFVVIASAWLASRLRRPILATLCASLLGAVGVLLVRSRVPAELWVTYAVLPTLLVGLLALQVPADSRRPVLAAVLAAAGMLGALFLALSPALSLLDRPLVQMTLFLPLSFAGGVGAAGLRKGVLSLVLAAVVIYGLFSYSFTPSFCCQLADPDDVVALNWLGDNLPPGARVGIAAADVRLTAEGPPLRNTGADAGIWLEPLTGRRPVPLSRFTDFTDETVHKALCKRGIGYLYIGGRQESFQSVEWPGLADWYRVIFALPRAQIIHVEGCQEVPGIGHLGLRDETSTEVGLPSPNKSIIINISN